MSILIFFFIKIDLDTLYVVMLICVACGNEHFKVKNELARIADELSKQNELLVLYANKISKFKKSIAAAIAIVLFIAAIYES